MQVARRSSLPMPAASPARIPTLSPAALAVAKRFAAPASTPLARAAAANARPATTPAVAAATPSAADMITTPAAIVAATAPTSGGMSTAPAIDDGAAVASTERGVPLLAAERQLVDAWDADAAGLPEVAAAVKTKASALPAWALPAAGAAGLAIVAFLFTRKR